MKKIKIKFTNDEIVELCALIDVIQHQLIKDILLDVKEINCYRLDSCIKIRKRMYMMILRMVWGKPQVIAFDMCEQLTLRYCLIKSNRSMAMQNLFTIIDKGIHPSMFERS